MANRNNPRVAGLWFGLSLYLNSALLLLATPAFTRLLTPAEFGEVALLNSLSMIVGGVATLSLYAGVFDRTLVDLQGRVYDHVAAMMGLITVCTLAVALAFGVALILWGNFTGIRYSLLGFMFLNIVVNSAYLFWRSAERFEYRYRLVSMTSIGSSVVGVGAAVALMMMPSMASYRVEARVFAAASPLFLCGLMVLGFAAKKGDGFYHPGRWRDALLISLPLLPHYLAQSLLQQFDRFAIDSIVGKSEVGTFGLACAIASGLTLFWTAINSAWTPWLYRALQADQLGSIRRLAGGLIALVAIAVIVGTLVTPEVIHWMAPAIYGSAAQMLPYLLLGSFFQFTQSIYLAAQFYGKKSGQITVVSLVAAVFSIAFNVWALAHFGAVAAAWAAAGGQLLQLILHRYFSQSGGRSDLLHARHLVGACVVTSVLTVLLAEGVGAQQQLCRWVLASALLMLGAKWALFLHKQDMK